MCHHQGRLAFEKHSPDGRKASTSLHVLVFTRYICTASALSAASALTIASDIGTLSGISGKGVAQALFHQPDRRYELNGVRMPGYAQAGVKEWHLLSVRVDDSGVTMFPVPPVLHGSCFWFQTQVSMSGPAGSNSCRF